MISRGEGLQQAADKDYAKAPPCDDGLTPVVA